MYPNYFDLLKQLTTINPKNIKNEDFDNIEESIKKLIFVMINRCL